MCYVLKVLLFVQDAFEILVLLSVLLCSGSDLSTYKEIWFSEPISPCERFVTFFYAVNA